MISGRVPQAPVVIGGRAPQAPVLRRLWRVREASTLAILLLEIVFFGWYLWPEYGTLSSVSQHL